MKTFVAALVIFGLLLALIIASPIMAGVAIAIKAEDGGPVFYKQLRMTKDKQEFYEFILALDALKRSLNGEDKTIILDKDSDLAKILMGAG